MRAGPLLGRGVLQMIFISWAGVGARINYINTFNYIHRYIKVAPSKDGSGSEIKVGFKSDRSGRDQGIMTMMMMMMTMMMAMMMMTMPSLPTCFTVGVDLRPFVEQVPHTVRHQPQSFDDELLDQAAELWLALCRGRQRISQMSWIATSRTPICRG